MRQVKRDRSARQSTQRQWQRHVDTGIYPPQPHLLLDDLYVQQIKGLKRVVQRPQRISDQPLLRAQRPWEGISIICRCHPIIYDHSDRKFKFWYQCPDPNMPPTAAQVPRRYAYATSRDGLRWTRPNLGLVEYNGSKKNNIVSLGDLGPSVALLQNVVRDDRDPDPKRRFKSIGLDRHLRRPGEITWTGPDGPDQWYRSMGSKIGCGIFVGYSPDGVRWTMKEGWCASAALIADGSALHGFDERSNKWVMWQRPRMTPKYRIVGLSTSDDFETWTFPETVLAPDDQDPRIMEFDSIATVAAPDGGYIGLLAASGSFRPKHTVAEITPQLVYSRDGRTWTRVSRKPFIERGQKGAWDDGCVLALNPIVKGDEVFIYYYGKNNGITWGEPTRDGRRITESALGLFKMQRDRWVAVTPVQKRGQLTTSLVTFVNNEIHVNVNAARGSLRVELIDFQTRKPVPGYTQADCDPITADTFDQAVTWHGKADLTNIIGTARRMPKVGRALVVRFYLESDAHLYSFSC